MKTEHPALSLLTDLIEDIKTESAPKNVTEETNIELLNLSLTYYRQFGLHNTP